jgi:hypothetical protein
MTPATALKIAHEAYEHAFVRGNPDRIDDALSRVEELRAEAACTEFPVSIPGTETMPTRSKRNRRPKVYLVRGGAPMQVT